MMSTLDTLLPVHVQRSAHEIVVAAPAPVVWEAMRRLTPGELSLTRTLMAIRGLPERLLGGDGRGRAGDADAPLVDQFLASGFAVLAEEAPYALAVGAVATPWRLRHGETYTPVDAQDFASVARPGSVRMAMAFDLAETGAGTRLRTETRVQPTDAAAAAAFGRYWRVIRLGSALIRMDMLRAIRRRAERTGAAVAAAA